MRPPHSPFCSSSSSSSSYYSLAATSLNNRLSTIFKKAQELTTLCDIKACVIHYGPDGELNTWPEERDKVRDLALRYIQLDKAKRRKKSDDLYGFLNKMKEKKTMTNSLKKAKRYFEELKYPISDHYTPDQINKLIRSLELSYSILQERRRFLESQKQAKTNWENHHQQHQYLQIQSLNPTQFTKYSKLPQESGLKNHLLTQELCVYDQNNNFQNHCVSNTQGYLTLPATLPAVQESGSQSQKEIYGGYDQNMCLDNINVNNFQHPYVSNTQDCSALASELQGSTNNYGLNQLMQNELYGFDQNMCTSDITNISVLDPSLSNRVSDDFSFDFPDMSSGFLFNYGENRLLQPSTLPSL